MVLTGKALDWAITLCSGAGFLLFGYVYISFTTSMQMSRAVRT